MVSTPMRRSIRAQQPGGGGKRWPRRCRRSPVPGAAPAPGSKVLGMQGLEGRRPRGRTSPCQGHEHSCAHAAAVPRRRGRMVPGSGVTMLTTGAGRSGELHLHGWFAVAHSDCAPRQNCRFSPGPWCRRALKPIAKSSKLANVCYDIRGPGARQGPADGGRGPQDHQAEHRQPGRVRPRAAGRDRAGHDPQPAALGRRLHRQQGPVRTAQGGGALRRKSTPG